MENAYEPKNFTKAVLKAKPSSHREFFERIYGNIEKFNNSKSPEKLTREKKMKLETFELSRQTYQTELSRSQIRGSYVTVEPSSRGFSAFLARRKRKEVKARRQRTSFSCNQTLHLENEFRIHEYISRSRRYELAQYLQLTEMQIKIWFQNRRAKDKRIEKAQIDQHYRNLIVSQNYVTSKSYYETVKFDQVHLHQIRLNAFL